MTDVVTTATRDPADDGVEHGRFGPNSVAWRIHTDPAMIVAGFRVLLLRAVQVWVAADMPEPPGRC